MLTVVVVVVVHATIIIWRYLQRHFGNDRALTRAGPAADASVTMSKAEKRRAKKLQRRLDALGPDGVRAYYEQRAKEDANRAARAERRATVAANTQRRVQEDAERAAHDKAEAMEAEAAAMRAEHAAQRRRRRAGRRHQERPRHDPKWREHAAWRFERELQAAIAAVADAEMHDEERKRNTRHRAVVAKQRRFASDAIEASMPRSLPPLRCLSMLPHPRPVCRLLPLRGLSMLHPRLFLLQRRRGSEVVVAVDGGSVVVSFGPTTTTGELRSAIARKLGVELATLRLLLSAGSDLVQDSALLPEALNGGGMLQAVSALPGGASAKSAPGKGEGKGKDNFAHTTISGLGMREHFGPCVDGVRPDQREAIKGLVEALNIVTSNSVRAVRLVQLQVESGLYEWVAHRDADNFKDFEAAAFTNAFGTNNERRRHRKMALLYCCQDSHRKGEPESACKAGVDARGHNGKVSERCQSRDRGTAKTFAGGHEHSWSKAPGECQSVQRQVRPECYSGAGGWDSIRRSHSKSSSIGHS